MSPRESSHWVSSSTDIAAKLAFPITGATPMRAPNLEMSIIKQY